MSYDDSGYEGTAPLRRRRYACTDRMCGADDCETCGGPGSERSWRRGERSWLEGLGYEHTSSRYDTGYWSRTVSSKTRTARRDHADGKVKAGDVYVETIIRYIDDESGESRHVRAKYVIQRAAEEG